jgi:hypothetical protein
MRLKCFDSLDDVRAGFTAHFAVNDPRTSPDAPYRENINVRRLDAPPSESITSV